MSRRSSRTESRLIKSVVVVREAGSADYCIGFVARVERDVTFIITQSSFVRGKEDRLKVSFFDKNELTASVVGTEKQFCLLRTAHHRHCRIVQWAEDRITSVSEALIFVPSSSTTLSSIRIFVTLESAESYRIRPTDFVVGSDNLFLVSCPYVEKTFNAFDRLIAAPVFSINERALGIVVFDCHLDHGGEMKVCLLAEEVASLISRLIPAPVKAKRGGAEDSSKGKKKVKK